MGDQASAQISIDRATEIARGVRAALLRLDGTPKNLAGACGLAALLMALALDNPRTLCTGFYMKFETFLGKRGRFPHRHAWCRVGTMIVDATATQFDRNNRAVHVARYDADPRYLETSRAGDAIDDILINWRGRELPAFVQLARRLRRSIACPFVTQGVNHDVCT